MSLVDNLLPPAVVAVCDEIFYCLLFADLQELPGVWKFNSVAKASG
jgi:hypothetical protein